MMKSSNRLISVGAAALRRLCTAAFPNEEPKRVVTKSLYSRLTYLKVTGRSVEETINQYTSEGKKLTKDELTRCVEELRKYRNYGVALELMEWMQMRCNTFFNRDHAILIDLLSKVKGTDSAEMYFNSLPPSVKKGQTYGALLNCYCKNKMKDKAVTLFAEMNEQNIVSASLNYNNLMALYMRIGEPEMVPLLEKEMKEKNISLDTFTYSNLMACYTTLKDTSAVERIRKEMESNETGMNDWTTYSNLAVSYVRDGLFEKAELALKDLERTMKVTDRAAYHFLISLYARTSNSSEVYRVWRSLKWAVRLTTNLSYLVMLQALSKLDDFDGIQSCYREWQSGCSTYDMRLANVLLRAYLERNMIKEANLLCQDAIKRSSKFKYTTYQIFVDFFLRHRQPAVALRCLEAGLSKLKWNNWKPGQERVNAFLKLFEEENDVAGAEKFSEILKRATKDDTATVIDTEVHSRQESGMEMEKEKPEMPIKMEADKIRMNPEIEDLVELICTGQSFT